MAFLNLLVSGILSVDCAVRTESFYEIRFMLVFKGLKCILDKYDISCNRV